MESVTRNVRTYDHFCLVARTLERVGDRWSLLVIRDLLTGAKRFTDLMDRLGGITPKTLALAPGRRATARRALLRSAIQAIDLAADDRQPARWHFRLDGADYLAESDGQQWSLTREPWPPRPV
jgi:HxlR-like helix-turn-helix